MPQPTHSYVRRPAAALLALGLAWARLLPAASPTAQALYRPAAAPPPVQILWNNGSPWSWDGVRLDLQTYLGGVRMTLEQAQPLARAKDDALRLSADAACPRGCDAGILRLVLPTPVDPAPYLASGHLALEVKRIQPMRGFLVVAYGGLAPCMRMSVNLATLPEGRYQHLSLPLAEFKRACAAGPLVTVPFELSVKGARYPAGALMDVKFIRWTPN
jgi:hypothetical protein